MERLGGTRPSWFEVVSNLLSRSACLLSPEDLEKFLASDGVLQGDPLSTLLFATAMTVVARQVIAVLDLPMQSMSDIDDAVLLGGPDAVVAVLRELLR